MKKLLIFSLLFITLTAQSQVRRIFGSSYFDIRTHKFGYIGGVNGTDTLGRFEDTTHFNWFKPIRLARWADAGRPSSPLSGYLGYNTDSNRIEYYNGTSWQQPGVGGGGSGGAPGGSGNEGQYRVDATTFGGMAGTSWDNTNRGMTHTINSLGTTQTTTGGYILQNTTAAAAGAQQISPPIYFKGFGWKTTATAASQSVDWRMYNLPVQGSANPTGTFLIQSNINGAGYTNAFTIGSDNSATLGNSATAGIFRLTTSTTNSLMSAGNRFDFIMNNAMSARASGTWTVVSGTTVIDPNTYTAALWNSISTTLPQFNAAYNTTNTTLFQTNSSGDHTITPSGGDLTVAGTLSANDQAYDESTWNASTQVPTKNAVRDEFESRPKIIWRDFAVNTTSGTAETDLYTYTTPANTLNADGQFLEYEVDGVLDASANNGAVSKSLRLYWAGTLIHTYTTTLTNFKTFTAKMKVIRVSSANSRVVLDITARSTTTTTENVHIMSGDFAVTFSGTNIIKITGETANAAETITSNFGFLRRNP